MGTTFYYNSIQIFTKLILSKIRIKSGEKDMDDTIGISNMSTFCRFFFLISISPCLISFHNNTYTKKEKGKKNALIQKALYIWDSRKYSKGNLFKCTLKRILL